MHRHAAASWMPIALAAFSSPVSDRLHPSRPISADAIVGNANREAVMREEVTPRFPAVRLVSHAREQWRAASGIAMRAPTMTPETVIVE